MRYIEFKELIRDALTRQPAGLTWAALKNSLDLPYERPCPTWVRRLEEEIGLTRTRRKGQRAYVWTLRSSAEDTDAESN